MQPTHALRVWAEGFGAEDVTSPAMRRAVETWYRLYFDSGPTPDCDPCQRIPYAVVHKLTRAVFGEYAWQAEGFAKEVMSALDRQRKKAMQMALIGGECYLKPIFGEKLSFRPIDRRNFLVFDRDVGGCVNDMGLAERTRVGDCYYTLLERRKRGLTIENRLYRARQPGVLGRPVPLGEAYPELSARSEYPGAGLGLAALRTPVENCVDGSADPVSVFAAAVGLIENIDRNEAQLSGEFQRGQSRILASADLLRRGPDGSRSLSDHLFVGLDDDPDHVGITVFSPQLREQSFLARKQDYLRSVETVIGLKRGTLSQVESAPRTATEITETAGDYHLTVLDFRQAWEDAAREALQICGHLAPALNHPGAEKLTGEEVSFTWGNGVLYD